MSDFREGDIVSLRARVIGKTGSGSVMIRLKPDDAPMCVMPDRLELVERPGPKLADLPDGTVVTFDGDEKRTPWEVMEDDRTLCWHRMLTTFEEAAEDWTIIGAKPGTPAWTLFETGDPEWWAAG